MTGQTLPHLVVCVITYRRPTMLDETLGSLERLERSSFRLSVIVIDNDAGGSARTVSVERGASYGIEPRQGIPYARNRALRHALRADPDLIAFIDDDEIAAPGWAQALIETAQRTAAELITGPVEPMLPPDAPRWAGPSGLFGATPAYRDGDEVGEAFTGNLALRPAVLRRTPTWFDEGMARTGGTDVEFTSRLTRDGARVVWSASAVVHEHVPAGRLRLAWVLRRGFRIGNNRVLRASGTRGRRTGRPALLLGAFAELLVGTALIVLGIARPGLFARGLSRCARSVGTFAGFAGVRYEEYR